MTAAMPAVGWIGTGRMGYQLALRLLGAGYDVAAYNRTRAKAELLAAHGAKIVDVPADLAGRDVVCVMVAADEDLEAVISGPRGLLTGEARPQVVIDSSTVSTEASARIRDVVEAARLVKIAHNVFLGVVAESLAEITVLAERGGVSRAAFLEFLNDSVLGSAFTRYKSPAVVNLDFHPAFTAALLRKDLQLGLSAGKELGVPMPLAATADMLVAQAVGAGYADDDFATLVLEQARRSGYDIEPENVPVDDGLTPEQP